MREQFEPSARPGSGLSEPTFYRVDVTRLTFAELLATFRNPLVFLFAAMRKILRWRLPVINGQTFTLSEPFPVESLPIEVQGSLASALSECTQRDFDQHHAIQVATIGDMQAYGVLLSHRGGTVMALVMYLRVAFRHIETIEVSTVISSRLRDGRTCSTTNARHRIKNPPDYVNEYYPAVSASELIARHWQRLAALPADAAVVMDAPAIQRLQQENSRKWFEFQRNRGVLQALRPRDVERLKRQRSTQSVE